ncbi:MAG: SAM-dependent methyltransferase, partial [Cyanobacteria bacterium P01_D01_bin.2]
ILLWNKELQPSYGVYQQLAKVYHIHAPSLMRYEDKPTQEKILQGLGAMIDESGQFQPVVSDHIESEVVYTTAEYLALLTTYSPYLRLEAQSRKALFNDLKDLIDREWGGRLQLSYISAFHIAQKA